MDALQYVQHLKTIREIYKKADELKKRAELRNSLEEAIEVAQNYLRTLDETIKMYDKIISYYIR